MGIVRTPKEWDETCSQCRGSGTVHKRERFSLMTPDEQRQMGEGWKLMTIDPKYDPPADAMVCWVGAGATIFEACREGIALATAAGVARRVRLQRRHRGLPRGGRPHRGRQGVVEARVRSHVRVRPGAPMTAPDIDALARATIALGEAATPGPWWVDTFCDGSSAIMQKHVGITDHPKDMQGEVMGENDAVLIAAYRTSAPALATALLAAREAMREARSAAAGRNPRKAMAILDRALRSGAGQGEGGGG